MRYVLITHGEEYSIDTGDAYEYFPTLEQALTRLKQLIEADELKRGAK